MKSKLHVQANDGTKHYNPGDEYSGVSEMHLKLLANDLAEPLDDEAKKAAASPQVRERYSRPHLRQVASDKPVTAPKGK